MNKVLIIGAGGVGHVVAHKCAQMSDVYHEIHLASRTKSKCDAIAADVLAREGVRITTHAVDADDVPATVALLRDIKPDLVLNVALPYQDLPLMDACLEAGVHYMDTANYEPRDVAKFEYKWQWAYQERYKAAGLYALMGSGFDPGVTNVYTAWALKHHFDEIEYLDIIDVNGGDHGQAFATNFNPEINIREVSAPCRHWEQGAFQETPAMSKHQAFTCPEGVGTYEIYRMYHEEMESLVKHIPTIRRAQFWMSFSPNYINHLTVLKNVGMTRIDPVLYNGVEIILIMPVLLVLVLGIAVFSLTISHTDADGVTRTGMQGLKILVVPDFKGLTLRGFFTVLMDAMGQLFYSISVAMGIMVTYGSYVQDRANLSKSINQIEIFDTVVAFLAAVMIIPAVYTFMGREGMDASGPSLMFVSLPKVFEAMGGVGHVIGALFFLMVFFAALTSAVSVMEAIVACLMDQFHLERSRATIIETVLCLVMALFVCLGYNALYFDILLPNGSHAQLLDVMDYISNNFLMPVVAIGTCILIGWVVKPRTVIDEIERNGCGFGRKKLYVAMIKVVAPILLTVLLLKSVGILTVI